MLQLAMCQTRHHWAWWDFLWDRRLWKMLLFSPFFVNKTKVLQMLSSPSTKQFRNWHWQAGVIVPFQKFAWAQLPRGWGPLDMSRNLQEEVEIRWRTSFGFPPPFLSQLKLDDFFFLRKTKLIWSLSKILACKIMQQNPNFGTAVIAFPS